LTEAIAEKTQSEEEDKPDPKKWDLPKLELERTDLTNKKKQLHAFLRSKGTSQDVIRHHRQAYWEKIKRKRNQLSLHISQQTQN